MRGKEVDVSFCSVKALSIRSLKKGEDADRFCFASTYVDVKSMYVMDAWHQC